MKTFDDQTPNKLDKVLGEVLGNGAYMDRENEKKKRARTEVKSRNDSAEELVEHACVLTPSESQDLEMEETTKGMKGFEGFDQV